MVVHDFSEESRLSLQAHEFPGNVREMQNVVERAVILCGSDGVISPAQLNLTGREMTSSSGSNTPAIPTGKADGFRKLEEAEKEHIIRALAEVDYNKTKAAKLLGISIRTLRNKLTAYEKDAKTDEDLSKLGLDKD